LTRAETKSVSDAIARTEREIALIHEYRIRLAADVVTGKVDVREAAASLPDTPVIDTTEVEATAAALSEDGVIDE
jgi:type I restriction enzyme S subunit